VKAPSNTTGRLQLLRLFSTLLAITLIERVLSAMASLACDRSPVMLT
jgi:hypothetical protein